MPSNVSDIGVLVEKALHLELFRLNNTAVTPLSLLLFGLVVLAFYFLSRVLTRGLLGRVLNRTKIESGVRYTLVRISHYLVMIVGTVFAFQFVGIDLSGLAVVFGLLSVGIGFGLQNVTSNFVAGLILLFERPIKIGDRVTVGDTEGDVEAIKMRATMIRTLNNISIIVPNSEFISSNVVNWSHGDSKIRLDLEVGVSYGSDLDLVLKSLKEVAEEHPLVLKRPEADVLFRGFGDSSWNMLLRAWIDDPRGHHVVRSEINCGIVRKFREKGI
ncbi:MAG: mechanosensitive ion channel domain-containing protein, partial [bacterium]